MGGFSGLQVCRGEVRDTEYEQKHEIIVTHYESDNQADNSFSGT